MSGATPGEDGGGGGRTVSMEPVGEVTLDGVPEDLLADVFGVDATVKSNGNPGPEVMPHGPLD